jgi:hypothetical protein
MRLITILEEIIQMECIQRDFRKDKFKAVNVRAVCGFTPLENIARNNSVQTVRSPGVNRAYANYLISNGVTILIVPCVHRDKL